MTAMARALLLLLTLTTYACCYSGKLYESIEKAIREELLVFRDLNGITDDNAYLSNTSLPYMETEKITEDTCLLYKGSCQQTTFMMFHQLLNVTRVTFNVSRFSEQQIATEAGEAKVSIKKARTDLRQTMEGWQISVKASPSIKNSHGGPSISGEVGFQYTHETTIQQSVTSEVTLEHTCPPHSHCGIITLTFFAVVSGYCRTQPTIICYNDRTDACEDFEIISRTGTRCTSAIGAVGNGGSRSNDIFKWSMCRQCDQWLQYKRKRCNGLSRYEVKPCQIKTPVLKDDGTAHTHIIFKAIPKEEEESGWGKRNAAPVCGRKERRVYVEPLLRD
ncbi:hypothetical protein DCS_00172 [Drechmeria coniospora]|uniref:Uncharacterized protein n=1 Tax=Drechmeria coniospora TaxID=98403 RepID=A0A151GPK1_DRECN|nr:hypothetical protein DCS_00172 [Drechmeria coniospora]KYK59045.1 hypothetical protein DCS_00172 [Drechmeria coniospora]